MIIHIYEKKQYKQRNPLHTVLGFTDKIEMIVHVNHRQMDEKSATFWKLHGFTHAKMIFLNTLFNNGD